MLTLTVVNRMLATLGEKPLSSLTDTHRFLGACLDGIDEASRDLQGSGWWFNREEVTLEPSPIDDAIYLPNDCLDVRTDNKPQYVKRGEKVYNTKGGTFDFTDPLTLTIVRKVEFEDLPEPAASYIAAAAVLRFQTDFDGDTAKARDLEKTMNRTLLQLNIIEIRNAHANLINANSKLARLKAVTYGARRNIR